MQPFFQLICVFDLCIDHESRAVNLFVIRLSLSLLQHNLLTELREVVLNEDRARFDELVYRRNTLEHDRALHRVSLARK